MEHHLTVKKRTAKEQKEETVADKKTMLFGGGALEGENLS